MTYTDHSSITLQSFPTVTTTHTQCSELKYQNLNHLNLMVKNPTQTMYTIDHAPLLTQVNTQNWTREYIQSNVITVLLKFPVISIKKAIKPSILFSITNLSLVSFIATYVQCLSRTQLTSRVKRSLPKLPIISSHRNTKWLAIWRLIQAIIILYLCVSLFYKMPIFNLQYLENHRRLELAINKPHWIN